MSNVQLKNWPGGIDNTSPDYALAEGHCLDALNVDFKPSGTAVRRPGRTPVVAINQGHSLWSGGGNALFGYEDKVAKITGMAPFETAVLRSGLNGSRLCYAELNGTVWWSNGTQSGRVGADNVDRPWAPPAPGVFVLSTVAGGLFAGKYRVALTYTDDAGVESPSSATNSITLGTDGGIGVLLPAAPAGVVSTNVYATTVNGTTLRRSTTVSAATGSVSITVEPTGKQLGRRAFLAQQPAGTVLAIYNGRLLSANGKWLTFSEPFNYGQNNPLRDAIQFQADITLVIPCVNGVFVTADKTYWLQGPDIAQAVQVAKLDSAGISGTSFCVPDLDKVGWVSDSGVVIGSPDGSVVLPQEKFVSPVGERGSAVVRLANGLRHVICVLSDDAEYPPEASAEFIEHIAIREVGL